MILYLRKPFAKFRIFFYNKQFLILAIIYLFFFLVSHPSTLSDSECPSGRHSVTSAALPPNLDIECVAWGTVTKSGGRISIPGSGKSILLIIL